jgi:intracellular sulfur oxidation DsrE/DsrF family protein
MSKILNVIETAYRATIEEQDDPVVWLTHALRGAGADIAVLLRGAAVNYAVRGQDASGLSFGARQQTQPPRIDRDLAALRDKGVAVHAVEEDLAARGIERADLIEGVELLPRQRVAALFAAADAVWHW